MASMKLCKPSFNYGASQSNFSKYEHQEHHKMSQSSHVDHGWVAKPNHGSNYYSQAQGAHMSQASHGLHGDELGQSWADDSTNYYAQAHSVLPMPSLHVQQSQHMMEKKESHVAQEWSSNGAKCLSPGRANSSAAMMAKMEHGWAKKSNQCSSPTKMSGYGGSMYDGKEENAYQYPENGAHGGWAGKPAHLSGSSQVNQYAQMMYGQHKQQGWASGPTKYPSSVQANHSSSATHEEEHMMEKMDHGWAPSPTAPNQSSISMHNEDHMIGKMSNGWAGSPKKASHSSLSMRKEEHMVGQMDHGWVASPTKANHSSLSIRKEEHMMGKMDHSWVASPTKANHSSLSMRKEEHMMGGKMDHGWVASPTKANHSSLSMHKEEHVMGQMDHDYAGSNHSIGIYKDEEHHGWAAKKGHSYGAGVAQIGQSANGSYNQVNEYDDNEDVNNIMDEILTKYPTHHVGGGHGSYTMKPVGHNQAWGGSAHHGSSAKSVAWSERKESKAAYSASSNVVNYGMSGGMSSGGIRLGNIGYGSGVHGQCHDY